MDQSPLVRLPGELRNAIYDYAMDCDGGFAMVAGYHYSFYGRDHYCTSALPSVCKQIRSESLDRFFKRNQLTVLVQDAFGRVQNAFGRTITGQPQDAVIRFPRGLYQVARTVTFECQIYCTQSATDREDLAVCWRGIECWAKPVLRLLPTQRVMLRFNVMFHRLDNDGQLQDPEDLQPVYLRQRCSHVRNRQR